MKRLVMILGLIVLAGLAGAGSALAETSAAEGDAAPVRVGTFDSRAIAMAYYRSEAHMGFIKNLKAEHAAAKAAGDDERAAELEAEGRQSQELAHKQGFGTWPVDDILERIRGDLPRIAADAGVEVIISKWDIVYAPPAVEFIDVTRAVVMPYNPDEATLKLILDELPKVDPVPLEELENHHD